MFYANITFYYILNILCIVSSEIASRLNCFKVQSEQNVIFFSKQKPKQRHLLKSFSLQHFSTAAIIFTNFLIFLSFVTELFVCYFMLLSTHAFPLLFTRDMSRSYVRCFFSRPTRANDQLLYYRTNQCKPRLWTSATVNTELRLLLLFLVENHGRFVSASSFLPVPCVTYPSRYVRYTCSVVEKICKIVKKNTFFLHT